MNPIAILAFIAGIGTPVPTPKADTAPQQEAQAEREKAQTDRPALVLKAGGWDRN